MPVGKNGKTYLLKFLLTVAAFVATGFFVYGQYFKSELLPPPPPVPEYMGESEIPDSTFLPSPVQTTIPWEYNEYMSREYAADLSTPSNITLAPVYDPETGMYLVHSRVGDRDIVTPFMMNAEEYNRIITRQEMFDYFQQRNAEIFNSPDKQPFNVLDMNFAILFLNFT